ncbi:hypothetical protein AGMMS49546_39150 [Spirochaetia bacterium]|nr:hypothetical protein AGMMS49546_39150 [Spirochaetia bacterium]
MLGILFFFLQGIPFIYQGQELGMTNYPWKSLDEFNDVSTFDQYQRALAAGFSKDDAFRFIQHRSRDNARTPMLWDNSPNAGFSSGKPWLPVHPDYVSINAEAERQDADSVFAFYRSMIAVRKKHPDLFFAGDFIPHCEDNPSLIVYERSYQKEGRHERALVICNFSDEKQRLDISNIGGKGARGIDRGALVLLGNRRNAGASIGRESIGNILLEPLEGLVLGL